MNPGAWRIAAREGASRHLLLVLALFFLLLAPPGVGNAEIASPMQAVDPASNWVVQPGVPGPDLPPVGRSLFDYLVAGERGDEAVYRIPFPYTALRERIARELRQDDRGSPGIREVLIPLGRSLQRSAAAPEFFRFPRVVLAVDGEPQAQSGKEILFLKDRLYLGYLEKPGVLEVISYNEAAGRFEFQVVFDYRADATPRVVYANRAVCTACHQNQTPIFARPLWGESNANPAIADMLQAQSRDFYGIPQLVGIDTPGAIDDATDRANLIPAIQLLWQRGCGSGTEARSCRARALGFALQYRLTGQLAFMHEEQAGWSAFVQSFNANWRSLWPDGLLLSSPDLPNRIPHPAGDNSYQQRHIPSALEPLQPRAPLARWQQGDAVPALVTGIAGFFAASDLAELDAALSRSAERVGVEVQRLAGACRYRTKAGEGERMRTGFHCRGDDGALDLEGRLYFDGGRLTRGSLDRWTIAGSRSIEPWNLGGERIVPTPEDWRIDLRATRGALRARLPDGVRVGALQLRWQGDEPPASQPAEGEMTVTLELVDDFALLERLLDGSTGDDALSDRPLRRAAVLRMLAELFDMDSGGYCCIADDGLPPIQLDPGGAAMTVALPAEQPESAFYRRCALCHRSGEQFPPNFLSGTPAQVRGKLAHCAERIYSRLAMWGLPEQERSKTPMPPFHAIAQLGLDPQTWPQHPDLEVLRAYAAAVLRSERGTLPPLDALLQAGYERLRPCLAQAE